MIDINSLSMCAFEHIKYLASEIGPRPAGSSNEHQTIDYIESQLLKWDYKPERQQVLFAAVPSINLLYIFQVIIMIIGCFLLEQVPYWGLILPFTMFVLPQVDRILTSKRKCSNRSQNIYTYNQQDATKPTLILCAHVDTGIVSGIKNRRLFNLYNRTPYIIQRITVATAILSICYILGFSIPPILKYGLCFIASIVGFWWISLNVYSQIGGNSNYSPGAMDNASGVGILLALAEYFGTLPIETVNICYLFTGAEETGMHGSTTFVSSLQDNKRIVVLNFDMVGIGQELNYVYKEGTINPIYPDKKINSLIKMLEPKAKKIWYIQKSGDFVPFIRKGITAASLEVGGFEGTSSVYHTIWDTIDRIQISSLDMVIRMCVRFIHQLSDKDNLQDFKEIFNSK